MSSERFGSGRRLPPLVLLLSVGAVAGCASRSSGREPAAAADPAGDGRARNRVSIIVNADDVGGHVNFTDASILALETKRISSASVLAPGPDSDRALEILKRHPEYDIGVHLALTGSWSPLTPGEKAPGLRSPDGTMWDTSEEAAAHVKPDEARMEWEAQILKVRNAGVRITHLDSHMGCYFASPGLYRAALDLAKKYGVPLISPYIPAFAGKESGNLFPVSTYDGIYSLSGKEETLENRSAAYDALLGRLPAGIHYLYTHHGRPDLPSEGLEDLPLRIDDFDFWTGDASARMLGKKEIGLSRLEPVITAFRKALGRDVSNDGNN